MKVGQLKNSNPEGIITAPAGALFYRIREIFYLSINGKPERINVSKKSFTVKLRVNPFWITIGEESISFENEYECYQKIGMGNNSTGWKLVALKNAYAEENPPISPTPTYTPTPTPTPSSTPTPTASPTSTPTVAPTATPTATPLPATATPTPTAAPTSTPTVAPTATPTPTPLPATATPTPTATIAPITYLSLQTDGTANSYGEASYVSAYGGLTDFTAEFWFKLTSWVGDWDRLFDHNQQTGFSITRNQGTNSIQFRVMDTGVNSSLFTVGNWNHIACVRSGVAGYIYINGVLDSSAAVASGPFTTTQSIGIGQNRTNGSERVAGKFADVRLWNVARTGTQIANNYNTHLVGNESGLIANWKFIQGSLLTDSSATNNPITTGSATSFVSDVPY